MSSRRNLLAIFLAILLFAYIVYPVLALLAESLTLPVADYRARRAGWDPQQQPFGAPLRLVLTEPNARAAIWGTLQLAVLTVITSTLWGLGLALLWCRREFPGRRWLLALGYAPALMPPLVGTLAFFRLLGHGSLFSTVFPYASSSGMTQVLILHTYSFGLYAYAFAAAALEDADLSREEAARSLGASGWRVFFAGTWPAVQPALLASAFLTFMAAAASFSGPYFLDNSSRYLTVEILNESDPGMQRALSVVLAVLALLALPAFLYFDKKGRASADAALGLKGAPRRELPPAPPHEIAVRWLASLLVLPILLAPPLIVIAAAFLPDIPSENIFAGFAKLDGEDWNSLWRSTGYGASAAAIDLLLAGVIALALHRASSRAALPIEAAVMLALALPGSVLAVALLTVFNAPAWLAGGKALGHSAALLILAYVIRCLPLAVRPLRAGLQHIGGDLERAAASLGAARLWIIARITLPLLYPALVTAFLICFITSVGEYVASKLLFGVQTRPVSVRIDEHFRNEPGRAYALALCLMLLTAFAIVAVKLAKRRRG